MRRILMCAVLAAFGCESDSDDDGSAGAGGAAGMTGEAGGGGEGGAGGQTAELPEGCDHLIEPGGEVQERVQTVLIEAEPDQVVCAATGTYEFTAELSISVDGLTLRGLDRATTIFDFSKQDLGANGVLITGDGVTIESLQVHEAAGDGLRANEVDGITFRNLDIIWNTPEDENNGAYGVYPIGCSDVLVEGCYVKGASDAGVYVGQSTNILVRENEAEGNVAGIEIENSTDSEVVDNHAHDNTSGILVFNLPELPVGDGKRCKVHGNLVENNNVPNFGKAGSVVSQVPGGTGMFVIAADRNEIFDNDIRGNESVGILVISYIPAILGEYEDDGFDIYSEGNYIHGNRYENNGAAPQAILRDLGLGVPGPDILSDGCWAEGQLEDDMRRNCIDEAEGVRYQDVDFCGNLANPSDDIEEHRCTHESLPSIEL